MFYKFATKSITHSSEMWVMVSDLVAGPLNSPKAKLDAKISHRGVLAEPAHHFKAFTPNQMPPQHPEAGGSLENGTARSSCQALRVLI